MAGGVGPKAPGSRGNGGKTAEIKVRLLDSVAAGVYANSMMVHHSATEFVLDFTMVEGSAGIVVSRVVTTPAHAKRIAAALQENLAKYEAAYGPITELRAQPGQRRDRQPRVEEGD